MGLGTGNAAADLIEQQAAQIQALEERIRELTKDRHD
jgi:hypothetical protein